MAGGAPAFLPSLLPGSNNFFLDALKAKSESMSYWLGEKKTMVWGEDVRGTETVWVVSKIDRRTNSITLVAG